MRYEVAHDSGGSLLHIGDNMSIVSNMKDALLTAFFRAPSSEALLLFGYALLTTGHT